MLKTVSSITNAIGALNYKGTWNASTNTPTLASGVGTKGDYYVVSVAGTTSLDGISNWGVGDWVTFNGSVWQRVEGGADLNGVNVSFTGTASGPTYATSSATANVSLTGATLTAGGSNANVSITFSPKGAGSTVSSTTNATSHALVNNTLNNTSSSGITGLRFGDTSSGCNFVERAKVATNQTECRLSTEQGFNTQVRWATGFNSAAFQGNNSTAWSTTSDERVKTNIRPINDALGKICSLYGKHFEYKNAVGKIKTGFVAQEFEQTFPGHVTEIYASDDLKEFVDDDGKMKTIDADLIPYLVEAVKSLKSIVDAQAVEIQSLKTTIESKGV